MDISLLICSFLIIFMLHNLEEIFMVERWFQKTYPRVRERIPSFAKRELDQSRTMTTAQFSMVVFLLSIAASAVILISMTTHQYYLFLGLNIVFAVNIFTHPLQSLWLRCYVPGLWTSLLLIIPYYTIAFIQLNNQGILEWTTMIKALFVIIPFIPLFLFSHKIAEKWVLKE